MAVKIRLRRMGARGRPFYRVVVADSRTARDGRFIEILGHYDPLTDPPTIKIDEEKALHWLNRGAQPTDTAEALLKKQDIFQKFLASKGKDAGKPSAGVEASIVEEEASESVELPAVEAVEEEPAPRKRRKKAAEEEETPAETEIAAETAQSEEAPTEQSSEEQG